MTRQRAQLWMLGLLPLLVMRLLLPTGVMPAHSSHGFALVLCSSSHQHPAPDQGHARADTLCAFAAAGAAAPAGAPDQAPLFAIRAALLSLSGVLQCPLQGGLARSQTARGPPSFS
jgi:hypothetical protein